MSANAAASAKKLNEVSKKLGDTHKGFQKELHEHMLNIGDHIAAYGDVTCATILLKAFAGADGDTKKISIRGNAIRQWFVDFGGCTWNASKETFGKKREFTWDRKLADENPFWEYVPEPKFTPVDGFSALESLIKKLKRASQDTANKDKHKHITNKLINDLDEVLKTHNKEYTPVPAKALVAAEQKAQKVEAPKAAGAMH